MIVLHNTRGMERTAVNGIEETIAKDESENAIIMSSILNVKRTHTIVPSSNIIV